MKKVFIFLIVAFMTLGLSIQAKDLYSYIADAEAWLNASYEKDSFALANGFEDIKKIGMSDLSAEEKINELKTRIPNAFLLDNSVTNLGEASWERGDYYYSLGKLSQAVYWYEKSAYYEYPLGQYFFGNCYYSGDGVTQNYAKAIKWFRLSAEQGEQLAQFSLGMCYEFGHGVPNDFDKALKWYSLAAEQGHSSAQYIVAKNYYKEKKFDEALAWFTKSAEQGDVDAQFALGEFYFSIYNHIDPEERFNNLEAKDIAVEWYKKAAEQGHAKAQCIVGYFNNESYPYDEAHKWFRKSAMQGNVDALLCLCKNTRYRKNIDELLDLYEKIISTNQDIVDENYIVGGAYFELFEKMSLEDKLYLIGKMLGVVEKENQNGWFITFLKQYWWLILLALVCGWLLIKIWIHK